MRLSHKISDSFLLIGDSYKIFCGDRNNDLEEVKGDDCTLGHKQLSTRIIWAAVPRFWLWNDLHGFFMCQQMLLSTNFIL